MQNWWRQQRGRRRIGLLMSAAGAVLVVVSLGIFIPPLVGVAQRSSNDHKLLKAWKGPGSALTTKLPAASASAPAASVACGAGSPSSEYALVDFPSLPGIQGVAGNGNWSLLEQRSVVHYAASAPVGGVGNALIAIHREPNFEPLGSLKIGASIVVTSRSCQQYTYTITQMWTENPSQVTQLEPISTGSWLTVITCTPLWIDTQRIVVRAELQS